MDFPGVTSVFQVGIPFDREWYIHRLGRTARTGTEGRGIFIVTEAESFFPQLILKGISFVPLVADLSSTFQVECIAGQMEDEKRAKIYRAWLRYYKGHMKQIGWG